MRANSPRSHHSVSPWLPVNEPRSTTPALSSCNMEPTMDGFTQRFFGADGRTGKMRRQQQLRMHLGRWDHRLKPVPSLGSDASFESLPRAVREPSRVGGAPALHKTLAPLRPRSQLRARQPADTEQEIMQLFGIAHVGPCLFAYLRNRAAVQLAKL